jgi:hypothetical protein
MKTEQVILQRICGKVQKVDLIEDTESLVRILDLLKRQVRFLQQRPWVNALRFCVSVSESRDRAGGVWKSTEASGIREAHRAAFLPQGGTRRQSFGA